MNRRILKSIGIATVIAATVVPSALAVRPAQDDAGPSAVSATYDGYKSSYPPLHAVLQSTSQQLSLSPDAAPQDARHALGLLGVKQAAVDTSDVFTRYVKNHPQPASIPYLSHGVGVDASQFGGTGVEQTTLRPDDKAGARTSEPIAIISPSTGDGFNWGDAGIGAGGAIGLFLLMGLGAMSAQRNRKGPLTA